MACCLWLICPPCDTLVLNWNGCTSRKGKEFLRRDFLKDAVTATHCTLTEGCAVCTTRVPGQIIIKVKMKRSLQTFDRRVHISPSDGKFHESGFLTCSHPARDHTFEMRCQVICTGRHISASTTPAFFVVAVFGALELPVFAFFKYKSNIYAS